MDWSPLLPPGKFIADQRLDILYIELVLFTAWVNSMAMTDSKDRSIMDLDLVDKLLDKRKELVQKGLG